MSKRTVVALGIAALVVIAGAAVLLNRPGGARKPAAVSNAATPVAAQKGDTKTIAIRGATLIDGTGGPPLANAVILIRATRIVEVGAADSVTIPPGAEVIDATGKFVIPGLADMHNHLRSGMSMEWENPRPELLRLLAAGITMTFSPAQEKDVYRWLKTQIAADDAGPYAHFWGTGPMIVPTTSGFDYAPQSPETARAAVRELKALNVDGVKVIYDDMSWLLRAPRPMLQQPILEAVIDEAHKQSLKVYVHAPLLAQAKTALRAGADGLMHGIIDAPVDEEFLALMKKNNAVYVSTLGLYESGADVGKWTARQSAFDTQRMLSKAQIDGLGSANAVAGMEKRWTNHASVKAHLPIARDNIKRVAKAGIPVVAGTDTGLYGVVIGVSSQLELVLLAEAGLDFNATLQAATINAARMVGRDKDLGTIEPGKLADLVILDANPVTDVSNVRTVNRVVKGGVVYDPAKLLEMVDLTHEEIGQRLQK